MKKLSRIALLLILSLSYLMQGVPVHGQEPATDTESGYSVHIQKYKVEDAATIHALPLDGLKVDQVTDEQGKALEPMKGVSYSITRVTPMQGGTGFEPLKGEGAFTTTVTTDDKGMASVTGLAQGMYEIVEQEHEQLLEVMEPVIVELPFPQQQGEALHGVYIYPKSSAVSDRPGLPGTKGDTPAPGTSAKDPVKKLPQTSGNIGTYQTLLWILAMVLVMGLVGMVNIHRKRDSF